MITSVALIMCVCWVLDGAGALDAVLERIDRCDTRCSQGLQCKTKHPYLFAPLCRSPPEGLNSSSVFRSVSLSTVMRCEGRQRCSLHLRVRIVLQLTEAVHGVSICRLTAGTLGRCLLLNFPRAARGRMAGQQVEVENDCFDVAPGQEVQVRLKTVPNYCQVTWTSAYRVPECNSEDLRSNIPECISRLSYTVNAVQKELSVHVSDMLEDKDYYLRLCHKSFLCTDTGAKALIRWEEPLKNATLSYSRPLPCLCIEGWSAMTDSHRVQVCPFKDRLEELWSGVTFDSVEETLSWEPACPVAAVIMLCQRGEDGECVDLPHASQSIGRGKITFTKVDPHPQLCVKFTAGSQSWIRCPFEGNFEAWQLGVAEREGHQEMVMSSRITATFSVGLCVKSVGPAICQPDDTHTVHVEKHRTIHVNLTWDLCKPNICLQVKRLDVKYAATILHCHLPCMIPDDVDARLRVIPQGSSLAKGSSLATWEVTWVIMSAGVCLAVVITVASVFHIMLTVQRRRSQKGLGGHQYLSEKHTALCALTIDCVVPAFHTHPALHKHLSVTHSPQLGSCERATLLSD